MIIIYNKLNKNKLNKKINLLKNKLNNNKLILIYE